MIAGKWDAGWFGIGSRGRGWSGRLHVEQHMFDVARLVEAYQALGERFEA